MIINQNYSRNFLLAAAVIFAFSLTACNFESDRDYKSVEKDGAGDTTQRGDLEHDQHNESQPAIDASKPADSTKPHTPATGNDSSVKKDSSKTARSASGKPVSSAKPKTGRATLSDWTSASNSKKEMDKDGIYINADVMPEYPGGKKAIQRYIEDNIQYPQTAVDDDVEGTVHIMFAIDENGNVYKATTTGNAIGYGLEQEALRVVKKMPKWKPGMVNGKKVKTRLSLPVVFLIS
jgi:periplasmic protein TonB